MGQKKISNLHIVTDIKELKRMVEYKMPDELQEKNVLEAPTDVKVSKENGEVNGIEDHESLNHKSENEDLANHATENGNGHLENEEIKDDDNKENENVIENGENKENEPEKESSSEKEKEPADDK